MNEAWIYAIKFEGKVIYVGQTAKSIEERFRDHLSRARNNDPKCPRIVKHLREHDCKGYTFEMLEAVPIEQRYEREQFWIAHFDTRNSGCNKTIGGETARGEDHYMWGKKAHPQAIAASVAWRLGKPQSPEWRAAISRGNKGKHHGKTSMPVVCTTTGQEWPSIVACAEHFGVSMFTIQMIVKEKSDPTKRRKLKGLDLKLKEPDVHERQL